MPYTNNRKKTLHTITSSTERKVRKLETNVITQAFNNSLTCNTSDVLSSDESSTSQVNVLSISMDNASISSQSSIDNMK